jgi:hypothetical protein
MKGAKFAGTEVEFDEALEKSREGAEIIAIEHPEAHQPVYFLDERRLELANKFPEAAIMEAYKDVEQILLKLRERLDLPPRTNLRGVVRQAVERGLVEAEVEPFFGSFQQARNASVHAADRDRSVTPGGAIEYLGQARLLTSIFAEALHRLEILNQ